MSDSYRIADEEGDAYAVIHSNRGSVWPFLLYVGVVFLITIGLCLFIWWGSS